MAFYGKSCNDYLYRHIAKAHQPVMELRRLPLTPQKCPICVKILGYATGAHQKTISNKKICKHIAKYHLPTVKIVKLEKEFNSKCVKIGSDGVESKFNNDQKSISITNKETEEDLVPANNEVEANNDLVEVKMELEDSYPTYPTFELMPNF